MTSVEPAPEPGGSAREHNSSTSAPEVVRCRELVEAYLRGAQSAEVTVMELLIASEDTGLVEQVLRTFAGLEDEALLRLGSVWRDNRAACEQIAATLRNQVAPLRETDTAEESLRSSRALFDALVQGSEEASVAMYSLGNPEILAAATAEIVSYLESAGLLGPGVQVLDFGCGIGRIAQALATRVGSVHGIDLSPAMVEVAQRRCAGLSNLSFALGSGSDLAEVATRSHDLVLAVDTFPYVVAAGDALLQQVVAEVARVLRPGGVFAVLNFSYRDDLTRDREDVRTLAARNGFVIEADGGQPFTLWNGRVFSLRRAG